MTKDLRALLEAQKMDHDALGKTKAKLVPWVFHRDGNKIKTFVRAWRAACEKAGCPGRIPHDLRRTAVRNLVRIGIPERVAMKMTGHKTRSVFERYNIVSDTDLATAATRIDSLAV